jgi:hypothetical protein
MKAQQLYRIETFHCNDVHLEIFQSLVRVFSLQTIALHIYIHLEMYIRHNHVDNHYDILLQLNN